MKTVTSNPSALPERAAEFGSERFGRHIPGADVASWVNRPGVAASGKPSRLSRAVYISDSEVLVWGVGYPGFPMYGSIQDGRAFLREKIHQIPVERWMAFDQDGKSNFKPADLHLNQPGDASVAYSTNSSGLVAARPALLHSILDRIRAACGESIADAGKARNAVRRLLILVALNDGGKLDTKGLSDLKKAREALGSAKRVPLHAAETLFLRHLDVLTPDLLARHTELFWKVDHV